MAKSTLRRLARMLPALAGLALALGAFAARAESLDDLIKAAKAEGSLTFYTAATENIAKRAADDFYARYGVRANFIRLGSAQLRSRFSAEAASGKAGADLIIIGGGTAPFFKEGLDKGWIDPVEQAGLPVVESGEFPKNFLRFGGAVVQVALWVIDFNTDNVTGAAVPKQWKDVLNPRFKGRILLPDPKSADSYLDEWTLLADTYGPDFFAALRAQNPRFFDDGAPAVQGVGAGEGDLTFPAVRFLVEGMRAKGAPIDTVVPEPTSGLEMYVALTRRSLQHSPNAARLFAQYLMAPEGNKLFNKDPGSYSVYDKADFPRSYVPPKPENVARRAEIRHLLGLE